MKHLKIYLAGRMSGLTFLEMSKWRINLKERLLLAADNADCDITVINPCQYYNFEKIRHQSEREVKDFDLAHVTSSDIIVVNLEGLSSSIGTVIELHDANYHRKIPVIAFGNRQLYEDLHPWIKECITRIEDNVSDVVDYIQDFYMM